MATTQREDKAGSAKNNDMAAHDLATLKQEWDKLTDQKRVVIAIACPWFGLYFGAQAVASLGVLHDEQHAS